MPAAAVQAGDHRHGVRRWPPSRPSPGGSGPVGGGDRHGGLAQHQVRQGRAGDPADQLAGDPGDRRAGADRSGGTFQNGDAGVEGGRHRLQHRDEHGQRRAGGECVLSRIERPGPARGAGRRCRSPRRRRPAARCRGPPPAPWAPSSSVAAGPPVHERVEVAAHAVAADLSVWAGMGQVAGRGAGLVGEGAGRSQVSAIRRASPATPRTVAEASPVWPGSPT